MCQKKALLILFLNCSTVVYQVQGSLLHKLKMTRRPESPNLLPQLYLLKNRLQRSVHRTHVLQIWIVLFLCELLFFWAHFLSNLSKCRIPIVFQEPLPLLRRKKRTRPLRRKGKALASPLLFIVLLVVTCCTDSISFFNRSKSSESEGESPSKKPATESSKAACGRSESRYKSPQDPKSSKQSRSHSRSRSLSRESSRSRSRSNSGSAKKTSESTPVKAESSSDQKSDRWVSYIRFEAFFKTWF